MTPQILPGTTLELDSRYRLHSVESRRGLRVVQALSRGQILSTLAGILTTLLLFEVCLRPWSNIPTSGEILPISADSTYGGIRTVRYFREGIATIHLSASYSRITGNPEIAGAPWVVILGDSYVEGLQVDDRETMGARLESLARSRDLPLNVRQYGRSGNTPAHYILMASEVLTKWNPRMVVVAVNSDDFRPVALDSQDVRMELKDGRAAVFPKEHPPLQTTMKSRIRASALLETFARRTILDIYPTLPFQKSVAAPGGASRREEQVRASLDLLASSYGSRLFLLYIALPGLENRSDDIESLVLARCAETGMSCASTRERYIQARNEEQELGSGFINTAPGSGHYNAVGHRIMAESVWQEVRSRLNGGTW